MWEIVSTRRQRCEELFKWRDRVVLVSPFLYSSEWWCHRQMFLWSRSYSDLFKTMFFLLKMKPHLWPRPHFFPWSHCGFLFFLFVCFASLNDFLCMDGRTHHFIRFIRQNKTQKLHIVSLMVSFVYGNFTNVSKWKPPCLINERPALILHISASNVCGRYCLFLCMLDALAAVWSHVQFKSIYFNCSDVIGFIHEYFRYIAFFFLATYTCTLIFSRHVFNQRLLAEWMRHFH